MTVQPAAKSTWARNLGFQRERTLCVLVFDSGVTGDFKKTQVSLSLLYLKAYFKPT